LDDGNKSRIISYRDQEKGQIPSRIMVRLTDSVRYLVEAGHRLIAKKDGLGHGKWLPWLEAKAEVLWFGTSAANKLMGAARKFVAGYEFGHDEALQASRQIWGHNVRGTQGTDDNEWHTPPEYLALAREVLISIDLDPASNDLAQETVKAAAYFTKEDNGLAREWHGRVWLNPTTAAIMLTNNFTDTAWFHRAEALAKPICFTGGRVAFVSGDNIANPTQGQAFFYFGDDGNKFRAVFQTVGFVR
jgi:hypothetical protein